MEEYDFIVVGAGTAGCALIGSLNARLPSVRIAVIELGGDVISDPTVVAPGRWPASLGRSAYDYKLLTASQPCLAQRRISYPRGKGLGGSNLINVMIYSRGFRSDWDQMPVGWRSADIEPLFETLEAKLHLTEIHAGDFGNAVAQSAGALGFASHQRSMWAQPGVSTSYHATIDARSGTRLDLYRALGAEGENVAVFASRAEEVLIDSDMRCIGVRLLDGRRLRLRSDGEVVLCCGAVESPKLLQLSGIGPADLLKQHHIKEIKVLPVGEGLKDHTLLPYACIGKANPATVDLAPNSIQGWVHDVDNGIQLVILDGQAAPDIIPLGITAPFERPGCCAGVLRCFAGCVAILLRTMLTRCECIQHRAHRVVGINVCLMKPTSVGRVAIRSADASVDAEVDPQYLATDEDRRSVQGGIARARELLKSEAVKNRITLDLSLGECGDQIHATYNTSSYYHPTGTCRMGDCVDSELRVLGITGLRVADASVLPVHPRVGTMPACMIIGARCADMLANKMKCTFPIS